MRRLRGRHHQHRRRARHPARLHTRTAGRCGSQERPCPARTGRTAAGAAAGVGVGVGVGNAHLPRGALPRFPSPAARLPALQCALHADCRGHVRLPTGSTSQGEADCGQSGAQSLVALAMPASEAGYLLHERLTWALAVPAPEPPDPRLEHDASSGARDISENPQGGAVNSGRADSASRAGGAGRGALRVKAHLLDAHAHRQHRDVHDRREQQRLQPECNVFHGPGCWRPGPVVWLERRELSVVRWRGRCRAGRQGEDQADAPGRSPPAGT